VPISPRHRESPPIGERVGLALLRQPFAVFAFAALVFAAMRADCGSSTTTTASQPGLATGTPVSLKGVYPIALQSAYRVWDLLQLA